MAKQNDQRPVTGARWLGQHIINNVPARDLNEAEFAEHQAAIEAHEQSAGQKIYERLYAQGSNN